MPALTCLAVAYPVLELLGRNAAFFVARGAVWVEPVGVAVALTTILPLMMVGGLAIWRVIHRPSAACAHLLLLGALAALLTIQVLDRVSWPHQTSLGVVWIGGLAAAIMTAWAYRRSGALRSVLGAGWLLAPLVAVLFLLGSPVAALLPANARAAISVSGFERTPPIVMIVLDELPVVSLMAADGTLDRELFPTFARLSEEGAWYRNTTTVDTFTTQALPAILTGQYPEQDQLPIAADHPDNLFSILGTVYEVNATESLTQLCPDEVCEASRLQQPNGAQRLQTLATDVGIVTAHVLFPAAVRHRLPDVGDTWGGIWRNHRRVAAANQRRKKGRTSGHRRPCPERALRRSSRAVPQSHRCDRPRLRSRETAAVLPPFPPPPHTVGVSAERKRVLPRNACAWPLRRWGMGRGRVARQPRKAATPPATGDGGSDARGADQRT